MLDNITVNKLTAMHIHEWLTGVLYHTKKSIIQNQEFHISVTQDFKLEPFGTTSIFVS